jgi:hypothetical protein
LKALQYDATIGAMSGLTLAWLILILAAAYPKETGKQAAVVYAGMGGIVNVSLDETDRADC